MSDVRCDFIIVKLLMVKDGTGAGSCAGSFVDQRETDVKLGSEHRSKRQSAWCYDKCLAKKIG
jgi:hypothetical protein